MARVLIADPLAESAVEEMKNAGLELVMRDKDKDGPLTEQIKGFDGIVIRSASKVTREVIEAADILKVVVRAGVGLDNVNLKKAEELSIKILNTPKAPSTSVAELTIGLLLNLIRHISKADETMHRGEWLKSNYMGNILKGKKIGLIGFGNIGQAVAKRCSGFEMNIGIYDVDQNAKKKAQEFGYIVHHSIDELIQDALIVSLHIPATIETENTIDERRLKLMNENTLIINTARGKLIDEEALIRALKNKAIGGAALDVYREEPLKNEKLWKCEENLILTPHIGSQTEETQMLASVMIAEKIIKYFKDL